MTVSSNGRRASTRRRTNTGAKTSSKLENIKGESMSTDNVKEGSAKEITGPPCSAGATSDYQQRLTNS